MVVCTGVCTGVYMRVSLYYRKAPAPREPNVEPIMDVDRNIVNAKPEKRESLVEILREILMERLAGKQFGFEFQQKNLPRHPLKERGKLAVVPMRAALEYPPVAKRIVSNWREKFAGRKVELFMRVLNFST